MRRRAPREKNLPTPGSIIFLHHIHCVRAARWAVAAWTVGKLWSDGGGSKSFGDHIPHPHTPTTISCV